MQICFECEAQMKTALFCDSCNTMQVQALDCDYHTLFDLKESDLIETKALNKKLRALSRLVHPDFHPQDTRTSGILSAHVNQAFTVLSDPYLRLEYLCQLKGGKSATDDKSTAQSFLIEMMEYQERIEEEPQGEELQALEDELLELQNDTLEKALLALKNSELDNVRLALNEVSYCLRLLKNLKGEHEPE